MEGPPKGNRMDTSAPDTAVGALEEAFERFSRDFLSRLSRVARDNGTGGGDGLGSHGLGMLARSRGRALSLSRRVLRGRDVEGKAIGHACLLILLELYDAQLARRNVKVTALCYGTSLPQTTALRHIDELVTAGLIERCHDKSDKRRIFLSLSPRGRQEVDHFLDQLIEEERDALPSR
ncbi:MAG: winged helix DNA-binding protein [Alphaproteobacteria bacterium GM202ARS2]|nr:winged helix DNA-binding protein [Alphaproteobacteria bacterium GM202ARS2]